MALDELKSLLTQLKLTELPMRLWQARKQGMAYLDWLVRVEKIIDGTLPETRKRKANVLVRLAESYGQPWLEAACLWALAFGYTKLKAIMRILDRPLDIEPLRASGTSPPVSTKGCFLQDNNDFYCH